MVKSARPASTVATTTRFSAALRDAIAELAQRKGITVNRLIVEGMTDYVRMSLASAEALDQAALARLRVLEKQLLEERNPREQAYLASVDALRFSEADEGKPIDLSDQEVAKRRAAYLAKKMPLPSMIGAK